MVWFQNLYSLIVPQLFSVQFFFSLIILIWFNYFTVTYVIVVSFLLFFSSFDQDEEEAEAAFNQKHALQKAKEVGPLSSFMSSE